MDLKEILLSLMVSICFFIQSAYADVSVGNSLVSEIVTELETEPQRNNRGMLTGAGVYEIALDLYRCMTNYDKGIMKEHPFDTYGEANRVVQCFGYEILNGRSSANVYYSESKDNYCIGWSDGEKVMELHDSATNYINQIWAEHASVVNSISTESEKIKYLSKIIANDYIPEYDRSYTVYSVSDIITSGLQKGTCSTFAVVLDRLCSLAGIESYIELGYMGGGMHAWNKIVFSDGIIKYYDVTMYGGENRDKYLEMDGNGELYRSTYTPLLYDAEDGYAVGVPAIKRS